MGGGGGAGDRVEEGPGKNQRGLFLESLSLDLQDSIQVSGPDTKKKQKTWTQRQSQLSEPCFRILTNSKGDSMLRLQL